MLRLTADNTHLYEGSRGSLEEVEAVQAAPDDRVHVMILFSDGVMVPAELQGDVLVVEPYESAAGTAIGRKRWFFRRNGSHWRIAGRLPATDA